VPTSIVFLCCVVVNISIKSRHKSQAVTKSRGRGRRTSCMSLTFKLMQVKDQLLDLALSPLGIVTIILSALLYYLIKDVFRAMHMGIPTVRGGVPFFGQSFEMLRGSPWDTMVSIFLSSIFEHVIYIYIYIYTYLHAIYRQNGCLSMD
jgi:hypothetical protein